MRQRLVIVPHTHWDREWYRSREEFRLRLVALLDGLLDLLESDPEFRHFTLDGQTIVLDDYLELRPGARARIEALVRAGRLAIGPWYVLPDEWLVSGEALIRNLRRGIAQAQAFGGAMELGYVPDQFGHVGQLPQIFRAFGFDCAALWRGVGASVEQSLFRWQAPDGSEVLCIYLIQGYGNFVRPPLAPAHLAARLRSAAAVLAPLSPIPSLLLMNGSDHEMPVAGLPQALAQAAAALGDAQVEIATLAGFAARARAEIQPDEAPLALWRGELRSGLRAPLLVGCASARLAQKQADFRNDRLLTRYVEPLASLWIERGGAFDLAALDHAWRTALQNHPHDSICGCSIDAVHREMDVRFECVEQLAGALLAQVCTGLAADFARPGATGESALWVWNPHAAGPAQAEGLIEWGVGAQGARPPALHVEAADGRLLPARAVVDAPGALLANYRLPAGVIAQLLRGFPSEVLGFHAAGLRWNARRREVDVLLGSAPAAGRDFEAERHALLAKLGALAQQGPEPVAFRVLRLARLRVRFCDDFPGWALSGYRLCRGALPPDAALASERLAGGALRIGNATWCIEARPDGRIDLEHRPSGARIGDAIRFESESDRGDEYTFQGAGAGPRRLPLEGVKLRLESGSAAEIAIVLEGFAQLSAGLDAARRPRSRRVRMPLRLRIALARDLDRVELSVAGENRARDHRLRLVVRAPFEAQAFDVESAFEIARRPIAPAPDSFGSAQPAEFPSGASPQRGFAALRGRAYDLCVSNRGNAEVEGLRDESGHGAIALTLLRAIGWLSRDDLPLRPGHAGPGFETPGAQAQGPFEAAFGLRLAPAGSALCAAEAARHAAPPLLFAGGGFGERAPEPLRLFEIDDPAVLVSALEPAADGRPSLRIWNPLSEPRALRIRWRGRRGGAGLEAVDLRGRLDPRLPLVDEADGFQRLLMPACGIATLRPR